MSNKRIRVQISFKIFGIALSLLGVLGLVAYISHQQLRRVREEVQDLAEYIIPITNFVYEVNTHALEGEVHFERILKLYEIEPLNTELIEREKQLFEKRSELVNEEIAQAIALAQKGLSNASTQANRQELSKIEPILERIEREHQDFHEHGVDIFKRLENSEPNDAIHKLEIQLEEEEDHLNQEMETILTELGEYTVRAAKLSQRHQQNVLRNGFLISSGAIVLGLFYASLVTLEIVRPLRYLTRRIRGIQTGESEDPLEVKSGDEIGLLTVTFNEMLAEIDQKEELKKIFGKYIDPRIVAGLEDGGKSLPTKGEKQIVTVLMSDIEGFDPIAQTLVPEQLVKVINQYLGLLSTSVLDKKGFIEFVDTVIKGFWAQPFVSETEHAQLACEAALDQVAKLDQLRQTLSQTIGPNADISKIELRIGLATGPLILGNLGPKWSMVYTVMGDTVNTAARLKGAAKQYDVRIIMLQETQELVEQMMETRELGLIQVVGKDEKLRVYELLGRKDELSPNLAELNTTFAKGLELYRQQNWDQAQKYFEACLQLQPNDSPSHRYLQWIQELRDQTLPTDWDGVWKLTKK
ncbi:MAG: adenylate/guanylate cyclase domain-containing protein [Xenococcaceae cyanobacterium]